MIGEAKAWSLASRSRVFVVSLGLCFGVVFPETFMSTITFGSSIPVWFMKKVSSFIAQCEVLLTRTPAAPHQKGKNVAV